MEKKQKGFVIPLIVAIVVLLVVGAGVYVYVNKKPANSPVANPSKTLVFGGNDAVKSGQVLKSDQKVPQPSQVMSQAPTTYTEDGVVSTVSCGSKGCFENYFASCIQATLAADSGIFGAVEYKIVGKGTNGCNVTFKYTKYSDPTWINKDMTCEFDNKINFKDSMTKVFQGVTTGAVVCEGPLYDILRPR